MAEAVRMFVNTAGDIRWSSENTPMGVKKSMKKAGDARQHNFALIFQLENAYQTQQSQDG